MLILYFAILGPGTQLLTVKKSGVNVNQAIKFIAHGAQSQRLPSFIIVNDTVALETIEQYGLFLSNPSITNGNTLGLGTTIHIIDDDGKLFMEWVVTMNIYICITVVIVNFGQSLYSYSENHGVVSDITIVLSTAIAQSLTIIVFGGIELVTLYTL